MFFLNAVLLMLAAVVAEPRTVSVPLKQIWAHEIPGTKSAFDLEPKLAPGLSNQELKKQSTVVRINRALAGWLQGPPKREKVGPGFAVAGSGLNALKNAHGVLVEKKRIVAFPGDSEMSLVFFTGQSGLYVHLDEVKQSKNRFEIRYHFVTHSTFDATTHFALIPVGKLPPGNYFVSLVKGKTVAGDHIASHKEPSASRVSKTICESFEFSIKDKH